MRGKKDFIAKCLYASGATSVLSRLRLGFVRDVPILTYHRIWDVADVDRYPYDINLVSASVADFRWQMEYVRRHFTPITFLALERILSGDVPAPRRPILITFDDGYEDNYRLAFPILRSLGMPATMFISSEYIGSNRTFWFDQLAHLLLTAPDGNVEVEGLGRLEWQDLSSRHAAVTRLLTHTKMIPNESRLRLVAELHRHFARDESGSATELSRPMTWDNVREMAAAGIEIGSHTVRHPILTRLTPDELAQELTESKRTIESQIDREVTALGYPVGQSYAFNDAVCRATESAGYRFAAAFISGTNWLNAMDRYRLKRIPIERHMARFRFAAALQLPEFLG